jgi:hypothetical protein
MLAIVRRSLVLRGYINTEFVDEHYDAFLREIGPRVRSGDICYREDIAIKFRRPSLACWPVGTSATRSSAFRDATRSRSSLAVPSIKTAMFKSPMRS